MSNNQKGTFYHKKFNAVITQIEFEDTCTSFRNKYLTSQYITILNIYCLKFNRVPFFFPVNHILYF